MEETQPGKELAEKNFSSLIKNVKENQAGKEFNLNNLKTNLQEIVLSKNFQLNVEELKKNLILELKELLNDLEIEDIKVVLREKLGNNTGVDEIINYIKGDKHIDLKTLLKNNNLLDLKNMDEEVVEKLLSKKLDLKDFIKNLTYEDKKRNISFMIQNQA